MLSTQPPPPGANRQGGWGASTDGIEKYDHGRLKCWGPRHWFAVTRNERNGLQIAGPRMLRREIPLEVWEETARQLTGPEKPEGTIFLGTVQGVERALHVPSPG